MTHTREMAEHEGTFGPAINSDRGCRQCGKKTIICQPWSSHCGGFEDDKYECRTCGFVWWQEGPDA